MKTVLVLLTMLLAGCTAPHAFVRIVEYGGGGAMAPVTGAVGGCSVYQSKAKISVQVTYQGKSCTVTTQR